MKKFAAALLSLVLAAFVTLFGVASAQATSDTLTISQVPSSISGGLTTTDVVLVTNTGQQLSSISAGAMRIGLQNITLTDPSSCTGITLTVAGTNASTSCAVTTTAGMSTVEFLGVDYTSMPSLQIVFGSGRITLPTTGSAYFSINEAAGNNQPVLAAGAATYTFGQQQQQQQPTSASFTVGAFSHTPDSSVASLSNGDNFPGYTASFSNISGGTYDAINILIGDPQNGIFYTVPGAVQGSDNNLVAWDPASSNCGVTSITRGGTSLTASSGATCAKFTYAASGQATQYWIRVKFGSASSADLSITVAPGTFVVASQSSGDKFSSYLMRYDSNTNTNYSGRVSQLLNASPAGGVGSSGAPDIAFTLPTAIGQPVAGQTVGINASNLALNTNYSVILRSTPQVLEQGTTTATFMNTTVTIPAGLEPGWHSITFSAVRSDGVATEQVAYFKISDSGMLLQTSSEVPAELAMTAAPKGDQWSLGVLLAVLGIGLVAAVYTYRRRVFEMVYVLTGSGSSLDIELVEQPKNARYLPMRKL